LVSPDNEKLVIEVTAERITGVILVLRWGREPLVVPSPALYLAPVELSDAALLAQSIALPLIEYMEGRVVEEHSIPLRWWPLLRGLYLWQLWDLDIPLAQWRQELVKWLYIDLPLATTERQSVLPARYTDLCAMHRLWMLSPTMVGIPLECSTSDAVIWSSRRLVMDGRRTSLNHISVPLVAGENQYYTKTDDPYHFSTTVLVATLIEYAVATYGYEQLPVLLAALDEYDTMDTLLPAVYGVSSAEFEKGWRAYLDKEYDVQAYRLRP
jgi:hypothetical protein